FGADEAFESETPNAGVSHWVESRFRRFVHQALQQIDRSLARRANRELHADERFERFGSAEPVGQRVIARRCPDDRPFAAVNVGGGRVWQAGDGLAECAAHAALPFRLEPAEERRLNTREYHWR